MNTTTVTMTITPEQAKLWLDATKYNRKIKPSQVKEIAEDILNNEWKPTTAMIQIGVNGECVDGNHRLSAIVKANKPVVAIVLFEAVPNTKIDKNIVRTPVDQLLMNRKAEKGSIKADKLTLAAVNYIRLLLTGEKKAKTEYYDEYYEAHKSVIDSAISIIRGTSRHISKSGMRCCFITVAMISALNAGVSEGLVAEWYGILSTGYYTETKLRSVEAAKSIVHMSNALMVPGVLRGGHFDCTMLKKAMSSIRHFNNDTPIRRLVGEMVYEIPGNTPDGQMCIDGISED